MNKKLYVISKKMYERYPLTIENVLSYQLGSLAVYTKDRTIPPSDVEVIFNMYRFGSKDYDRILDMLKSQDKDSYNLALGILRSNNCIIYEKRT